MEGPFAVWGSGVFRLNPQKGKISYASLILVPDLPREMISPKVPHEPRHSQSVCSKGGKQAEWGNGWSSGEEKVKALCGKG